MEIFDTYAQETPKDWPCSVLSTILVLFVLFYIPDIANAQEQGKILDTSTIADNQNQIMPGPLYENSSVYANPANVNFSSYENLELGIETDYPSNWDIDDYSSPYSVYFRSLPEHSNDSIGVSLRIDVEEDSGVDSAIDFVNAKDALPNLRFIESPHNTTNLSNASTAKSVYTYSDSMQGEVKVLSLAIENNDKFYVFNYVAQTPNFNNYLPTIEKMIESLKIISVLSYENFDLGIRMKYSNDWNFTEFAITGTESVTFFFPHLEHNSDTLVSSNRVNLLSISAQPHSQDLSTVKEDFNYTIDYYESLPYSGSEDLRNFTFIDSTPTYLLGIMSPAHNVTYSYEEPVSGITIIETNIITIQNDRLYSISYSFPREEYAYYARIVNNMINSIVFFTPRFDPDTNLGLLLHYPSDFEVNHTSNTRITLQSIPDSNEKPEFVINVNKEGGSNYNKTNCNSTSSLVMRSL